MAREFDIAVIGAGIVGTSVAMQLVSNYPKFRICLIEKEGAPAMHQSGRNSGVIHSGIYYKSNSLKLKACRDAIGCLHRFCEENSVPYETTGKLIVATSEQEVPIIKSLHERGIRNGIKNLKLLKSDEIHEIEPAVFAIQGLFVPETGIVDYRKVANAYVKNFLNLGGTCFYNSKIVKIFRDRDVLVLETSIRSIRAKNIINCAGLYSDEIAKLSGLTLDLKIIPFRGEYYKLKPGSGALIKNIVYPAPNPDFPFLGVHFTRMIDGVREVGPNAVFAFKKEGYSKFSFSPSETFSSLTYSGFWKLFFKYYKTGFHEISRSFFKRLYLKEIQKIIPGINLIDLQRAESGVRAQALDLKGNLIDDFRLVKMKNMLHVLNAPSPAATASLSIGKRIIDEINKVID